MNCPRCHQALERVKYEGVNVQHCKTCDGYLVRDAKLDSIKRRREKSPDDLRTEDRQYVPEKSKTESKCPKCLGPMRSVQMDDPISFRVDDCHRCDCVWFDAGELALVQQAYEESEFGEQNAMFQDRFNSLSPQERKNLQEKINRLPVAGEGTDSIGFEVALQISKAAR